jgi:hypothetical protein
MENEQTAAVAYPLLGIGNDLHNPGPLLTRLGLGNNEATF